MKRAIYLLLALGMIVCLSACENKVEEGTTAGDSGTVESQQATQLVEDKNAISTEEEITAEPVEEIIEAEPTTPSSEEITTEDLQGSITLRWGDADDAEKYDYVFTDGHEVVVVEPEGQISHFQLLTIVPLYFDSDAEGYAIDYSEVVYEAAPMEEPVVAVLRFDEECPLYGISYTDGEGTTVHYAIETEESNGSLKLTPMYYQEFEMQPTQGSYVDVQWSTEANLQALATVFDGGEVSVTFTPEGEVQYFMILYLGDPDIQDDGTIWYPFEEAWFLDGEMTSAVCASLDFPGDMPKFGIRYWDDYGYEYKFALNISGYDGSLYLEPFE